MNGEPRRIEELKTGRPTLSGLLLDSAIVIGTITLSSVFLGYQYFREYYLTFGVDIRFINWPANSFTAHVTSRAIEPFALALAFGVILGATALVPIYLVWWLRREMARRPRVWALLMVSAITTTLGMIMYAVWAATGATTQRPLFPLSILIALIGLFALLPVELAGSISFKVLGPIRRLIGASIPRRTTLVTAIAILLMVHLTIAFRNVARQRALADAMNVNAETEAVVWSREHLQFSLDPVQTAPIDGQAIEYSGARLLLNSDGKYYFYRPEETISTGQIHVYVIPEDTIIEVELITKYPGLVRTAGSQVPITGSGTPTPESTTQGDESQP